MNQRSYLKTNVIDSTQYRIVEMINKSTVGFVVGSHYMVFPDTKLY